MRIMRLLVVLCLVGGVAMYFWGPTPQEAAQVTRAAVDPAQEAFGSLDRINVLVLGVDYNYTWNGMPYSQNARSDTMFVVGLDRWGHSLGILSIPRDTRAFLGDDLGHDKINAAYALGGVHRARAVVEKMLGVKIHHHVIVRVQAARELVDLLGGVQVTVEKAMDYDDNWGNLHVHLAPGPQRLNGEQAVGYCRFRADEEGDLGRIRRQQQFLAALTRELKKPAHLTQAGRLVDLFKRNLETDISGSKLLALANLYKSFEPVRLRRGTLVTSYAWYGDISYLDASPHQVENRRLVARLLQDVFDPNLRELDTEVLDGWGSPGVVSAVGRRLHRSGFSVMRVKPADRQTYTRTTIVLRDSSPAAMKRLMALFPGVPVQLEPAEPGRPSLTVVVGADLDGLMARL